MKLSLRGSMRCVPVVLGPQLRTRRGSIQTISEQQNLPKRFLEQIVNDLKWAGVPVSIGFVAFWWIADSPISEPKEPVAGGGGVSGRLAKWKRIRCLTGSRKKLEPGTAATPTSRAIHSQKSASLGHPNSAIRPYVVSPIRLV